MAHGELVELIVDLEADIYEALEIMAAEVGTTADKLAAGWIMGIMQELVRLKIEREEAPDNATDV